MKYALLLLVLCGGRGAVVWGGGVPLVTPTKGRVWPTPQMEVTQQTYVIVRPDTFRSVGRPFCDLRTTLTRP